MAFSGVFDAQETMSYARVVLCNARVVLCNARVAIATNWRKLTPKIERIIEK